MKAYKGFDKNMQCRGFQFKEGETYREDKADLCNCGFHACENPIDVFIHYAPGESEFREVTLECVDDKREKDSKVCAKEIKIGAKISLAKMINIGVKLDIKKAKTATSGDSSHAATSGKHSIAAAIGRKAKAKSALGNWIVLAEYADHDGTAWPVKCVRCGIVDGNTLNPDTWYKLVDGEFVECDAGGL